MAKFKCKQSGNIIELIHEVDIKTTLQNENYELVEDKPVVEEKPKAKSKPVSED